MGTRQQFIWKSGVSQQFCDTILGPSLATLPRSQTLLHARPPKELDERYYPTVGRKLQRGQKTGATEEQERRREVPE